MAKYGLLQAEPEVYGLVTDMTEQLMRNLITNLVQQSRIRRQDHDPKMIQSKPGDRANVRTVLYFDEATEPGFANLDADGRYYNQALYLPKETEPFEYICTSNVNKDLGYLMGSEYDQMKERQDNLLKF